MEKWKVHNKMTILLTILCLLSVRLSAQNDFDYMYIGAEVNGKPVSGKIVLHDNDTCTFFLLDKNGNKVTYLSSKENFSFEWNFKFTTTSGGTFKKNLNNERSDSIMGIRISPERCGDRFVKNIHDDTWGYCLEGEITCDLMQGLALWYIYSMPIELDVLPSVHDIEIVEQTILPENNHVASFSVMAENFKDGLFIIYDPILPPHSGFSPFISCWFFDPPCEMPTLLTFDYLLPEYGFFSKFYNEYGHCCSDIIYPDWSKANISPITDNDDISISIKDETCNIMSKNIINIVRIYDMSGMTVFSGSQKSEFHIHLNKGLYIMNITDNKGNMTRKRILIK